MKIVKKNLNFFNMKEYTRNIVVNKMTYALNLNISE